MNRIRAIIFFLLIGIGGGISAQINAEQSPFIIKGFVIGADTNNTIPLANILNKTTEKRYISNRHGAFGIPVGINDTLSFSVIGYQNYELVVRKYVEKNQTDPIKVRLKQISYKLKEVDINYHQKRRDSLARRAAVILKTSPLLNNYEHIDSWIAGSSGSPITELFAAGNQKLQEYKKLTHLIELYREQQLVDEKYTDDIIMRSTGLPITLVPEFKKFCNLPHYFILSANDYDLVMAIRECNKEYRRSKKTGR
ncbi:MAG: carboxypeptidase-like regulatory domain-containing protein [Bacteroidia bacterium]